MKTYVLVALLVVLMLNDLFAKIKNGYEKDVSKALTSIRTLRDMLSDCTDMTWKEKKRIQATIKSLINLLVYHQVTESLLADFKDIAPDLYFSADTLRDKNGRGVDVYVRFIPKAQAVIDSYGMVSLIPDPDDAHLCASEYGPGSVSVSVNIMNTALIILSHEIGHLQYMVPNLAGYVGYYKRNYRKVSTGGIFGHRCDDPGGKIAYRFERLFRERYAVYLKGKDNSPVQPFALIQPTRKALTDDNRFRDWVATTRPSGW